MANEKWEERIIGNVKEGEMFSKNVNKVRKGNSRMSCSMKNKRGVC